jgi:hypothetical protein
VTWIPSTLPTTISPTIIHHCLTVVPSSKAPTAAYITKYYTYTPSSSWPTFLPSTVTIPSSYVLVPISSYTPSVCTNTWKANTPVPTWVPTYLPNSIP